jgi:hypothetical protein
MTSSHALSLPIPRSMASRCTFFVAGVEGSSNASSCFLSISHLILDDLQPLSPAYRLQPRRKRPAIPRLGL